MAFETNKPPNEFFIDIWSVASKARVSRIHLPAELTRLAFNPSGTVLFTAQSENLQAWEIPSGKRRFSLTASGDIDESFPILLPPPSLPSLTDVSPYGMPSPALAWRSFPIWAISAAAAFSPDGRYLLTGYDERAAALWLWRSGDLRDQACARLTRNLSHDEWTHWFPKQPYRQICLNLPAAN